MLFNDRMGNPVTFVILIQDYAINVYSVIILIRKREIFGICMYSLWFT